MNYSKSGLELTKRFEGCRLTAYQDSKGVWTIGYGHTGRGVCAGLVWTQAQADAVLRVDVAWAECVVTKAVDVSLTQAEFDALVDFTFNVGAGAFRGSTMLRLLNAGNYAEAAAEFDKWDKCGGNGCVVAGLLRRRQAEMAEFLQR
jgi:lysozyme